MQHAMRLATDGAWCVLSLASSLMGALDCGWCNAGCMAESGSNQAEGVSRVQHLTSNCISAFLKFSSNAIAAEFDVKFSTHLTCSLPD